MVFTVSRITLTVALGRPMLPTDRNPGPMVKRTRPGAISDRELVRDARTEGWRVTGLDVAGYNASDDVRSAASASVRNTSRPLCWWSCMPTPENPAASHSAMKSAVSLTGSPTGTRMSTLMPIDQSPFAHLSRPNASTDRTPVDSDTPTAFNNVSRNNQRLMSWTVQGIGMRSAKPSEEERPWRPTQPATWRKW